MEVRENRLPAVLAEFDDGTQNALLDCLVPQPARRLLVFDRLPDVRGVGRLGWLIAVVRSPDLPAEAKCHGFARVVYRKLFCRRVVDLVCAA